MTRLLITGGPRTGKTTLANSLERDGARVGHTDDLIASHDWSEASDRVAEWMNAPGPWVIEGVAVVRALRKWLAAHPAGAPCDRIVLLSKPLEPLTPGQAAMAKGLLTVWDEIRPELHRRNVEIEVRS